MKVFLDTNVLLDFIIPCRERHPHALKLLTLVKRGIFKAAATTQSIIDVSYILSKVGKDIDFKESLNGLMPYIELIPVSGDDIAWAVTSHIRDFEDAAQFASATSNYCSVIISSDEKFKTYSRMWTFSPEEFLDYVFGDYPNLL